MGAGISLTPLENTLQGFATALLAKDRDRAATLLNDTFRKLTRAPQTGLQEGKTMVDSVSSRQVVGQNISEVESRVVMIMAEIFEGDRSKDKMRSRRNFQALLGSLAEEADTLTLNVAVVGNEALLERIKSLSEVRYSDNVMKQELSEEEVAQAADAAKKVAQAERRRIIRKQPLPVRWHQVRLPVHDDHGACCVNCLLVGENVVFSGDFMALAQKLDAIFVAFDDEIISGKPIPEPEPVKPGKVARPWDPAPAPPPRSMDPLLQVAFTRTLRRLVEGAPMISTLAFFDSPRFLEDGEGRTTPDHQPRDKWGRTIPKKTQLTIHDDHPAFEAEPVMQFVQAFARENWGQVPTIVHFPRATAPKSTLPPQIIKKIDSVGDERVPASLISNRPSPQSADTGIRSGIGPTPPSFDPIAAMFADAAAGLFTGFDLAEGAARVLARPTLLHDAVRSGCRFATAAVASMAPSHGYALRRDAQGYTALHLAVLNQDYHCVEALFAADPEIEDLGPQASQVLAICSPDPRGVTPLELCRPGKIRKLLRQVLRGQSISVKPTPNSSHALIFQAQRPGLVPAKLPGISATPRQVPGEAELSAPPEKLQFVLQKVRTYLKTQPARTFHVLENIARISRTPDDSAVSEVAAKAQAEFEDKVEAIRQARAQAEAEARAQAEAKASAAAESNDGPSEEVSSEQALASSDRGGFLTEIPDDEATSTSPLAMQQATEPQYHPPPFFREREIRVVIEAPPLCSKNVAGEPENKLVNVDDLLYIVDPSQHRSRAVSGASNFEVPDSASVNEQHEDDPLGSQGAESALVLSNTPVAPPNISNHDDGRGPSYSLGVAHAFLDYVPTAKEVFSGNGENSKSLKSGWNHAGDRVIRVNGRADFRAADVEEYPVILTCVTRTSPDEVKLLHDVADCISQDAQATTTALDNILLGINSVCVLPCGHFCDVNCAWSAACLLESETRYSAANLKLKYGQLAAGVGGTHARSQAARDWSNAWKWLRGALVQVDRGDDRYIEPANHLLQKAVLWSTDSPLTAEWRLLRCLAAARVIAVQELFDLGVFQHAVGVDEQSKSSTEHASLSNTARLVPGSGYKGELEVDATFWERFAANSATGEFDPRSHTDFDSTAPCEVVREAETGSNWRPRNKPFLDIRHDRHDLVPPPAEWNFPDWRHEQQQQLAASLLQRVCRVWAAQRFVRAVKAALNGNAEPVSEALKRTQGRSQIRRIKLAKEYEHEKAVGRAEIAAAAVANDDLFGALLFVLASAFFPKVESSLIQAVKVHQGEIVSCRVKPLKKILQHASGPLPTAAGGNTDLLEFVVELDDLAHVHTLQQELQLRFGEPEAVCDSFHRKIPVVTAPGGIRALQLVHRMTFGTWQALVAALGGERQKQLSLELLECRIFPQPKPKLTSPAQDKLLAAEKQKKIMEELKRSGRSVAPAPVEDGVSPVFQPGRIAEEPVFDEAAVDSVWTAVKGMDQAPASMLCSFILTLRHSGLVATRVSLWQNLLDLNRPSQLVGAERP